MSNRSRDKGTHGETEVVDWYHRKGLHHVERHALHGANDIGDITGIPGLVQSIKWVGRGQPLQLSEWLNDLDDMVNNAQTRSRRYGLGHADDPAPAGLLIVRRNGYPSPGNWYAVQTLDAWWSLYGELFT